ncbi:unnamed protein product [Protopolystoma xenopodis]|uniref:Uncharacterized protein n=1 Tax=Protopolystoma xenopodis TaxID=117903 RepID=A0A3S5BNW9_9PLAT|nr:unnamed protein product [Protopolystoma xenopodis]
MEMEDRAARNRRLALERLETKRRSSAQISTLLSVNPYGLSYSIIPNMLSTLVFPYACIHI